MNPEVRKSKIYSYFYGAGTAFQQFIVIVGILFIALGFASTEAKSTKINNAYQDYRELDNIADDIYDDYYDLYRSYRYDFQVTAGEKLEITDNDPYKAAKEEINNLLDDYNEASEKAQKAYDKYENMLSSRSSGQVLFIIIGGAAILAGLIWSIIKKNSFDKKSCEAAYDEELNIRIANAKVKAMEKLNIVAEQIDMVEPVVLNGVATYEASAAKKSTAKLAGVANLFSYIFGIIIGAAVAGLYALIASLFGGAFFIPLIAAIALVALFGIKLYKKYEKESYINPKKIDKLEKFNPNLITKLGTDEAIRVSLPAITVYMFGAEQIYMYYQYLDIVTGKIFCEGIHEYFYEDVVGVVSSQETKKVFKPTGFLKLSFKVIEYLRESITVVTSGCQHAEAYIVPMSNSLLDTSFVGMRNLIRQKKNDDE